GREALRIDGDVLISFGGPITYSMSGDAKVVDIPMASAYVKYAMPTSVDVGGKVGFEKAIAGETIGIQGQIDGWIVATQACNVQGSASLNGLGFHEGGEAVVSS